MSWHHHFIVFAPLYRAEALWAKAGLYFSAAPKPYGRRRACTSLPRRSLYGRRRVSLAPWMYCHPERSEGSQSSGCRF